MYVDRSGQLCSARDTTGHAQLHDIGCCMTAALWLLVLPPWFLQLNGVPSLVNDCKIGGRTYNLGHCRYRARDGVAVGIQGDAMIECCKDQRARLYSVPS